MSLTRDVPFSMYGKHEDTVAAAGETITRDKFLFRKATPLPDITGDHS